ncbi:GEVED domain-containing protein [Chryseobacterium sp. MIQD13]|uniref:GEVED domain-containing protein n=1 Tax=Chryseobacterium sp. MIQD13 TaxID=3422310 RepID=UPI003D29E98E
MNFITNVRIYGLWSAWVILMTSCTFSTMKAQAPLLTDSFNYTPGTLLTAANWTVLGTSTNPTLAISGGNLTYPGSITNNFGNKAILTSSGQDVYRSFTSTTLNGTTPSVYSSLIVNVTSAQAAGDYFFALGSGTAQNARIYIKSNGTGFSFGIGKTAAVADYETTVRPFGSNIMLVLKYEQIAGATNDVVKLFVNPPLASEPSPDIIHTPAIADITSLSSVFLIQGTAANAPALQVDAVNAGTTWNSVTSAVYDYGDVPVSYDMTKDGVFAPAVHSYQIPGFLVGNIPPDLELAPASVTAGSNNNSPNGDGVDEDAVPISAGPIARGVAYSMDIAGNSATTTTKYMYAWIDFNNDGRFQANEMADNVLTFNNTEGYAPLKPVWSAAKVSAIAPDIDKLYMRIRVSDRSLIDFTTATGGGDLIDERSIGNGAISATNAADHGSVANGEVEDYQVEVAKVYDFGDVPSAFEYDINNNLQPALHAKLNDFSIGTFNDVETAPYSVTAPGENNSEGDNEHGDADEDGITEILSVSRGVPYSITLPVNIPGTLAGTKYLYGWIDLNGDNRFQVGELASTSTTLTAATNLTLTWSAAQTNLINTNTDKVYLRLRLSNLNLLDYTAGASVDERSIGNGAASASNPANAPTIAYGEVEDYQLPVDLYDFGDVPVTYENGLSARQIALSTYHIGDKLDNEESALSVAANSDNNNDNGDGADEDGLSGTLPVITKGAPFNVSVPVTVAAASNIIAWIDFNNDGKFQSNEAAYTAATGTVSGYQTVAVGTSAKTFWFRGTQTNAIPVNVNDLYVRIRLTRTAGADNTGTTAVDERSIGDGASTGVYTTAIIGEIEDYRFKVSRDLDYGDAPESYEMDKDGNAAANFKPARNYTTEGLYLGQAYVLEQGPASVAAGADNNAPNGDGEEEDGLNAAQLNIRTNAVNNFTVAVNNTTGANAFLYAWIDFNNDGRFQVGESIAAPTTVANNATTANISFSAAQVNTIAAATGKVYMRLRLIQPNTEISIQDYITAASNGAVVDERAIADGLISGMYTSVSLGEVEDYQLTVLRDYGDAPASYENGAPASQTNSGDAPELTIGATIDYELSNNPVVPGADNNGNNGDGADEDGITTPVTVTSGAPFTLTVPVNTTVTGSKYLFGWIDFNGDGIFNGNEAATATPSVTAGTTGYATLTWTATNASASVLAAGKTYARLRLSGTNTTNSNSANIALIDTRSFGLGLDEGEIEDYQFLISNLYDYGDVPQVNYEYNKDGVYIPARQAQSSVLRLGNVADTEAGPSSVAAGADNNGTNGDGADEDGITDLAPIYKGIPYYAQVNVFNNSGVVKPIYGWIDMNGNGRFEVGEVSQSLTVPSSPNQQTVTLKWTNTSTIQPGATELYMRLRISELGTLTDQASGANAALVDERSIGDGVISGVYGTLYGGEVEDYRISVTSNYDYGDAADNNYDTSRGNILAPARQVVSQGLYLGNKPADNESAKQTLAGTASGDDNNGFDDEDGAVPGPVVSGGGYTLNVNVTNNTGVSKTLYGWIDFNNNGHFESKEMMSASVASGTNNGTATLTWLPSASSIVGNPGQLYMRLRMSEGTLTDNANVLVDERALADGIDTGEYAASPVLYNGEIEDYTIPVTTDLDYGDVPVSYEQPAGISIPARQISSAALQIGGTPDAEALPQSIAAGSDNNGTNGDGADEDGITPSDHKITPNAVFSLPVKVTNTVGTTKTLLGWLDFNNNGVFELGEVAAGSVNNNTVNGTVTLSWTAVSTTNIASPYVYLRLRLSDAAMGDITATTAYDERALADGLNTGAYAATAYRGEIEDYRLEVNPVYDFGDAPDNFEQNTAGLPVTARHKTVNTLYLGGTYDVEPMKNSVASGADNNGTNGDGTDEDGIGTPLPMLYSGTEYTVDVNTYKSISGTGTLHAWIDLDGNGRFTKEEYTSAAVAGATGMQTATLTWAAVPYSGTADKTYMRLRFTSASLVDNASTANVDERSVGDGLSSGIYGTVPVNGEVEDYQLPVDLSGINAPDPLCTGNLGSLLGIMDPMQAGFHSTLVRPASGGYLVFGELSNPNGTSNAVVPKKIDPSTGYNYQGKLLMATLVSNATLGGTFMNYHQYFALSTAGLYAWGDEGYGVSAAVTNGPAFQPISLPAGVPPARVKMIDAGNAYSSNTGSLVLLTTGGEVWVRSTTNAASTTNDYNAIQGDGNLLPNNGNTGWHRVMINDTTPLTGMLDVRTVGAAAIATNGNQFYTWGTNVFIGDGTPTATQHYATLMQSPSGSLPARQVDISYGATAASYFVLDNAGVVHVLGFNDSGQLGIGNTTTQTAWTRITQMNEEPEAAGNQVDVTSTIDKVIKISANNHDTAAGSSLILITDKNRAYHAGSNGGNRSGTVSPTSWNIPTAMTANSGTVIQQGKIVHAESGGHISILAKEGSDRYGYVGHTVGGSDGCNGCTNSPDEFTFTKTTSTGPLCGITAFDYGDLDDRYNSGDKAKHEIKYSQADNPLKLGATAADSEDGPQFSVTGNANEANGDDTDDDGDDEDAFTDALPAKITGSAYTLNIPLTNNTGSTAYLYGFIDWNGNGILEPTETVVKTISSSSSEQNVSIEWPDAGTIGGCQNGELLRSFVRLRLTTVALNDNTATPADERSVLKAGDGEVEDYYLDWSPDCGGYCYKPGATAGGETLITKMGITSLNRAGAQADNWPAVRTGGWLVLEAKTKGFVPNKVTFDSTGNPVGITSDNYVEGMLVYDVTNKCLKMYTSKDNGVSFGWYCVTTQTCPD